MLTMPTRSTQQIPHSTGVSGFLNPWLTFGMMARGQTGIESPLFLAHGRYAVLLDRAPVRTRKVRCLRVSSSMQKHLFATPQTGSPCASFLVSRSDASARGMPVPCLSFFVVAGPHACRPTWLWQDYAHTGQGMPWFQEPAMRIEAAAHETKGLLRPNKGRIRGFSSRVWEFLKIMLRAPLLVGV